MLFSEELIINVKKSELQPTYSGLIQFCHIARRWLSTGIILNQEKQTTSKGLSHIYMLTSSFPKFTHFTQLWHFTGIDSESLANSTDWLAYCSDIQCLTSSVLLPENYRRSLKSQGFFPRDTIMLVSWVDSKHSRRCLKGLSLKKSQIFIMALMIIPIL